MIVLKTAAELATTPPEARPSGPSFTGRTSIASGQQLFVNTNHDPGAAADPTHDSGAAPSQNEISATQNGPHAGAQGYDPSSAAAAADAGPSTAMVVGGVVIVGLLAWYLL